MYPAVSRVGSQVTDLPARHRRHLLGSRHAAHQDTHLLVHLLSRVDIRLASRLVFPVLYLLENPLDLRRSDRLANRQ